MRWNRTVTALAIGSATLLSVAACSSSESDGDGTITVAYQKTTTFTAMDDLMKNAKAEYEAANPGKTIKLIPIEAEQDQYFTKLALMNGSADTAPDVIYEDTFQVRSDAAAGYLLPIDQYVDSWSDWSQFFDGAKQAGAGDDGKIYGISSGTDTRGLYYNKDIFAKAGLPTDWQPKTWNDILDAARTIKQKVPDVIPFNVYAGQAQGEYTSMQGFEMLLYGTQNQLLDTTTHKWVTGSQGFQDSLKFYDSVFSEGLGPDPAQALDAAWNARVSQELLPQGTLAIALDGSWLPSRWISGGADPWPAWNDTLGFAAMPTQNGEAPGFTSMSGGWALAVGSYSDHPQDAFNFITTALNRENSLKYYQDAGQIAVRSDVASDPAYLDFNPSFKFFSSLVEFTHFRPATPDYSQISSNIPVATESVATGQVSPSDAQATYDEALIGIVGQDNTEAG